MIRESTSLFLFHLFLLIYSLYIFTHYIYIHLHIYEILLFPIGFQICIFIALISTFQVNQVLLSNDTVLLYP
jgi:hypothetical protein